MHAQKLKSLDEVAQCLSSWIIELKFKNDPSAASFFRVKYGSALLQVCITMSGDAHEPANDQELPTYGRVRTLADEVEQVAGDGTKVLFYSQSSADPHDAYMAGFHAAIILHKAALLLQGWNEVQRIAG